MTVSKLAGALRDGSPEPPWRYGWTIVRQALGLGSRLQNPDRVTLEQVILPGYAARAELRSVLFVGCDWYTHHYERCFPGRTYATIDPNPLKRRFGAGQHHVAGLERITELFGAESLDLIVCNGVWGWGLNRRAECEAAFDGCHACLRSGGQLLLGWNDRPGRRPMPLESLASLARFERERFGPLGGVTRHLANPVNRHTYDFYVKPAAGPATG